MSGQILTLNSGSSSIKFALYTATPEPSRLLSGVISGLGTTPGFSARGASGEALSADGFGLGGDRKLTHETALHQLFDWLPAHQESLQVAAAGHRVVHGGMHYAAP